MLVFCLRFLMWFIKTELVSFLPLIGWTQVVPSILLTVLSEMSHFLSILSLKIRSEEDGKQMIV